MHVWGSYFSLLVEEVCELRGEPPLSQETQETSGDPVVPPLMMKVCEPIRASTASPLMEVVADDIRVPADPGV